ncbi:MAG: PKD domain-containing protein, partial [Acidimicrobiia bacterium]|nr:PKD domain-containing protein [Acidimicrobiia bacterium]
MRTATLVAVLIALGVLLATAAAASGAAPVADAGGPYTIDEGDALALDASGSTDPELDTLTYAWDLDNDGDFDDATGSRPVISWATLGTLGVDDDAGFVVAVEIDDGTGTATDTAALTVANTEPTVTIRAPRAAAVGARYTIDVVVEDPGADTVSTWVVTWGDGRVDALSGTPGPVSHTYTAAGLTNDVTVSVTDDDGTWITADAVVPYYDAIDKVGRHRTVTGTKLTDLGPTAGSLAGAHSATVGPDGNLYVTGNSSNTVSRYDGATSAHLGTFVTAGAGGLSGPTGLTFGPDGNLYVASSGTAQVLRYNGNTGAFIDSFVGAGTVSSPSALAFGPDGNLYVTDSVDDDIERYAPTGAGLGVFTTFGPGDAPAGLTWGPNGNLFVSLAGGGRVDEVDATTGAGVGPFVSAGLTTPAGLRIGPDGALWVADYWTDQVKSFHATTGAALGARITEPSPAGPRGLAFVPDHQVSVVTGLVVNSTGDGGDVTPGDGLCTTGGTNLAARPECTLRAAIAEANAAANLDVVAFTIPPAYAAAPGVFRFTPASPYPNMSHPVILDAATQPGWSGDPIVELDGTAAAGATAGLNLVTSDSFIRGFILHSFADEGLEIDGSTGAGDRNTMLDNWVGFDASLAAKPNLDNGILVTDNASANLLASNIVGHNTRAGIVVRRPGTVDNVVIDNLVGVGPDGTTPMPNGLHGFEIFDATADNLFEGNTVANHPQAGFSVGAD